MTGDTLHLMSRRDLVAILREVKVRDPMLYAELIDESEPASPEEIRQVAASQGWDAAVSLVIATHDVAPSRAREIVAEAME